MIRYTLAMKMPDTTGFHKDTSLNYTASITVKGEPLKVLLIKSCSTQSSQAPAFSHILFPTSFPEVTPELKRKSEIPKRKERVSFPSRRGKRISWEQNVASCTIFSRTPSATCMKNNIKSKRWWGKCVVQKALSQVYPSCGTLGTTLELTTCWCHYVKQPTWNADCEEPFSSVQGSGVPKGGEHPAPSHMHTGWPCTWTQHQRGGEKAEHIRSQTLQSGTENESPDSREEGAWETPCFWNSAHEPQI